MFQALEYKDLLSKYNKDVVAHKALVGNKEVEVKAKKKTNCERLSRFATKYAWWWLLKENKRIKGDAVKGVVGNC